MNVNDIIKQLEQQKTSIERAIDALKELSGPGAGGGIALEREVVAGVQQARRRARSAGGAQDSESDKFSVALEQENGRGRKKRARAQRRGKRPAYTDDFRRKVVASVRNGMTFLQAAKKFGTTWFSVRAWSNSGRFEPGQDQVAAGRAARKKAAAKAVVKEAAA